MPRERVSCASNFLITALKLKSSMGADSTFTRQRQIEETRIALEERLLFGADCKWTPLNKSAEVYCRTNGRTYL